MNERSAKAVAMPTNGRSVALWAGVIGAPVVWGVQMEAGYAVSRWVCGGNLHLVPHIITFVCAVLALIGTFLSYRDWRSAGGGSPDEPLGSLIGRNRFLGMLGTLIGLMSTILIIAQGLPSFFYDGCWT